MNKAVLAALLLGCSFHSNAEVYRCSSESGETLYQQSPCVGSGQVKHHIEGQKLLDSVKHAGYQRVTEALQGGADPNQCEPYGPNIFGGYPCALTYPAISSLYNDAKAVKIGQLLIQAGADVNKEYSKTGWTVLALAISNGRYHYAQLLIDNGADINQRSSIARGRRRGITAIFLLVEHSRTERVQFALDHGADIDIQWNGWTPLLYALTKHKLEVAQLLISRGANLDFSDPAVNARIHTALQRGDPQIRSLIESLRDSHR